MSPVSSKKGKPASSGSGCRLTDLFTLLGKAHMLDVLHHFLEKEDRPMRFVELQRALRLSPNTLSDRLRSLVDAGLLTRTSYDEIPPRVDYQATKKAHDLRPTFEQLTRWAAQHDLQPDKAIVASLRRTR
jgi:DNA-binding HxlR family transcriptional regulator